MAKQKVNIVKEDGTRGMGVMDLDKEDTPIKTAGKPYQKLKVFLKRGTVILQEKWENGKKVK